MFVDTGRMLVGRGVTWRGLPAVTWLGGRRVM